MKKLFNILIFVIFLTGCISNPLTGKRTMAFVDNSELFPMAFAQYEEFLSENTIVTNTKEAAMVKRVGENLAAAAQKWFASEGYAHYLKDYRWEYNLILDDAINAWAMPGGKIVFYTGILPITQNEAGIAVVMGHEIAHAILNHGQQRMSGDVLQQLGGMGVQAAMELMGASENTTEKAMLGYSLGTTLGVTLPYSRKHEHEADHYGLILMAIAGYNPDEAAPFWERMSALGGASVPQFLSTHPSDASRIKNLRSLSAEAKRKAAEFGVEF